MASKKSPRPSARERLLEAAGELFYEEGVNTVGIDRVIERAGVAKASLYNTFGSKEELIRSYLDARHEARRARIERGLARFKTPRDKLLGLFDLLGEIVAEPNFRGCAFMRASAEAKDGGLVQAAVERSRAWMRELLVSLARDADAAHPERLGRVGAAGARSARRARSEGDGGHTPRRRPHGEGCIAAFRPPKLNSDFRLFERRLRPCG